MILLTSLHTLNLTAAVEAASIPPPVIVDWLLSIKAHTQQIERCVLYTQVTATHVDAASVNLSHLHHRLLVTSLTNISPAFRCSTYAAKTTLCIAHPSVFTIIFNRSDNLRIRQFHKMPLCLPPVPLPRPPPPAPAPVPVPEERQLGSKVDPSLHATSSSTFTGPAPSRTVGVDKASIERAANFPSASHNDDLTEKKSRKKPVPEPKYLLRCRYGCDGQSGPFKKVTSLRRHMMVVHHILRKPPYGWNFQ